MSAEQRRAELEVKRAKLEKMRQEKSQKPGATTPMTPNISSMSITGLSAPREDADPDKILKEVGIHQAASLPMSSRSISPATASSQQKRRPPANIALQICQQPAATISVPPKELVTYSKEVQTIESGEKDPTASPIQHDHLQWDDEFQPSTTGEHNRLVYVSDDDTMSFDETSKASIGMTLPPAIELKRARSLKQQHKQQSLQGQASLTKHELTNDERDQILRSDPFQDFFSRTSRLIERSLWESPKAFDIFKDYSGRDLDGQNEKMDVGEIIKFDREFFDERWTRHRIVTCIDTSTYHPELVLASYSQNDESSHESDGVVLIWNSKYKSKPTPEYIFNCQSWVTSCAFSKFHPNIVLGGTYSGQIVVWDTRTNKRTPVQRTALSASSHTHPVYCLQVIGTQNANNLISISNEGKMCSWNIEMMTQPQESMDLAYRTKPVAATRMVFPGVEVNNFIIGSEEGQAYSGSRHGNKAGIQESYEGHFGPITGLSCHNVNGSIDFSPLFLTSSFDWSVKLWSLKESKPLNSFEVNSDYVTDVRWSPVHPSVFLTCDITGRFDIWNLNHDSELPLLSTTLDGNVALNKCLWAHNGQQIILGDDQGKLRLYGVNEFLTNPKQDDFNKLSNTLQDFKRNTLDAFDDNHPTNTAAAATAATTN
ncbi:unnamed protein product [Rotaria magnacalcarata]|uniref:Cytoplasmic dynein 1 intermediate chain 2 n=4 Tax=Rotaria magnacalcarata TaxID=392030 RepID=A0A815XN90_9BILA|nr:unnamed protein product [Rotaria magnacalcarata]CAF1559635.1 unnamed protein product [Rotaria magnacalcarata]CAF2103519.1 unnamed protein product [Rotaria magnacalcarata]CAF2124496.1 unnamed protein product [Rotaria magnacalcarata]CAF2248974.1 unnamed protein product [Rotaria magnacalcarata]